MIKQMHFTMLCIKLKGMVSIYLTEQHQRRAGSILYTHSTRLTLFTRPVESCRHQQSVLRPCTPFHIILDT